MPAIRSRMSSSSSTTRTSGAINDPFLLIPGFLLQVASALLPQRKAQCYFGTLFVIVAIAQHDLAAMVLKYFPHNRQSETGALCASCHIRLRQAMAMLMRQSDPVVFD